MLGELIAPPHTFAQATTYDGLTAAIERGRAARLAWAQDGTLLTAADYAAARGIPLSVLPELEARGELFSLDVQGARWYPSELLKLSPEAAAALCRELAGDNLSRQFIFLMRTHGALAGQTVSTAIGQGRLARVSQLAHAWRCEPQQSGGPLVSNFDSTANGTANAALAFASARWFGVGAQCPTLALSPVVPSDGQTCLARGRVS
jgi:hypothetical protein